MLKDMLVKVTYAFKFLKTYGMYAWYGLKGRLKAFFSGELSIFGFLKSLFRLPFEAWVFTRIDMRMNQ